MSVPGVFFSHHCKSVQDTITGRPIYSAIATGGPGGGAPLTAACASPFWFTQNTVLETSRNDKTAINDVKRKNYVKP